MTCPHLRYRILYRHKGSGLIAAASYNSRCNLYDESEHCTKYPRTKKDDHILTQMLLPPGAPQSYNDPQRIWNDLLSIENNKLAYNLIIPFQRELTFNQNLNLIKELLIDEFVSKGHPVQIDVHDGRNGNIHIHAIASDRQLIAGQWDKKKSETIYYRRGTVTEVDAKGAVINPDAVILTMADKIDSPKLKKKKLQYDDNGNIIFEKGWKALQYDDNGKPLLDEKGRPVLIDIREPLYPNEYYTENKKDAQAKLGDNKAKNGKTYKKDTWKKASIKHSDISSKDNIKRMRSKWEKYQNEYFAKYNVLDKHGETLKVDLRSYKEQNKERPADDQLIPTVHVMPHYIKEAELKEYNKNAKRHNDTVREIRKISRQIKKEQKRLKTNESNIIALHQKNEKLYERINPRKLFTDAWEAGYNNMLHRRRTVESDILQNIEKHLSANNAALQKIDRNTRRGEANYYRLSRHNMTLFSYRTKLQRNINMAYNNIKTLASAKFERLSNSNIVSFIRKQYKDDVADVVADVLTRTRKDIANEKSPLPPDAATNENAIIVSAKAIFGKATDIEKTQKSAIADWNKNMGDAPPSAVLQILDTYYSAEDYYIAALTGNSWRKQYFAQGERPEKINEEYQQEIAKIEEEERTAQNVERSETTKPVSVANDPQTWTQEKQDRLGTIRDTHYKNLVAAAQPWIADDLTKTQRTKALKIMRTMLFDDKDKLFQLYDDAAKAAKDYYQLKPQNTSNDKKAKPVNLTPDQNNTQQKNNAHSK